MRRAMPGCIAAIWSTVRTPCFVVARTRAPGIGGSSIDARNGRVHQGRFGSPAFTFSTAYSTIASAALPPVADAEAADADSGIRDVLLQAHALPEELQRVDDRRGFLEALHPHHANPLSPGEDFQDCGVADQVRGLHEVRPGGEENAPRDRDAGLR